MYVLFCIFISVLHTLFTANVILLLGMPFKCMKNNWNVWVIERMCNHVTDKSIGFDGGQYLLINQSDFAQNLL